MIRVFKKLSIASLYSATCGVFYTASNPHPSISAVHHIISTTRPSSQRRRAGELRRWPRLNTHRPMPANQSAEPVAAPMPNSVLPGVPQSHDEGQA